jgi:hypothetical protein
MVTSVSIEEMQQGRVTAANAASAAIPNSAATAATAEVCFAASR